MKRIQRKRIKGWKMPENTLYVGRPGMWGNPFRFDTLKISKEEKQRAAADAFRKALMNPDLHWVSLSDREHIMKIRDKIRDINMYENIACWCKEGTPCHADALIELAQTYQS